MSTIHHSEVFENPKDFQDSPRRIQKGDFFYPSSILAEIEADIREQLDECLRKIVANKLEELTEGEGAMFDKYVAIRLLKQCGYDNYLSPWLR